MYSIDIENMYPTIPTNDNAIKVITKYLAVNKNNLDLFGFKIHHIIRLLKFLLNNIYFNYNDTFYIQHAGLGTGYHSSEAYAEIIVDHTYKEAIKKYNIQSNTHFQGLTTYVDEAWVLWLESKDHFTNFLKNLNSI